MSVVLGQVVVTVVAAIVCFAVWGRTSGLSALAGGGISTIASLVMAALSFRRSALASAQGALRGLYVGEAAKLATVVVLFVWVLRTLKVSPPAMIGAFMATLIIYWVALANALPTLRKRAA
ncbi:MAG TPA: ATP synthase subunit I [Steroidobacteraceae bacterium]|jgi:F0F1-type ATP synthase assembly protein I|nr:ATP synthase subunit I [Steroidobacteraceae bacterium]